MFSCSYKFNMFRGKDFLQVSFKQEVNPFGERNVYSFFYTNTMSMGQDDVMEEYLQFYKSFLGKEEFPWLLQEVKMEATKMWTVMGQL